MDTFTLLIDYSPHPDAARDAEFRECLVHNLDNPYIEAAHLLTPHQKAYVEHPKLVLVPSAKDRHTYSDFFSYASDKLAGKLVIVANCDIKFNDTLGNALRYDWAATALALSRDDLNRPDSQDAWIFRSPMPNLDKLNGDFNLGILGCDNRIAYEIRVATGLGLRNPCRSVILEHVHRNRTAYGGPPRIAPPYAYVGVE